MAKSLKPAAVALPAIVRPMPPDALADPDEERILFAPAPELADWLRAIFIDDGAPLFYVGHRHLAEASIACLWTNVECHVNMRRLAATAELPRPNGSRWSQARGIYQMERWFGKLPDFLITVDAPLWAEADDASACALSDHELCHCAVKRDRYGEMLYNRLTDKPVWAIRGHDVEQFVSVTERFGAVAAGVTRLVEAAQRKPLFEPSQIALACGTCAGR